jgi:hypothetical protein
MNFFSKLEMAPPPDLVGDLKRKLDAEQSHCAELSAKHQSVAFEAETTGDSAALNDLAFEISKSRGRIETLQAAHREAQKRDAMAEAKKIRAERQARITAWKKTLDRRAAVASKLTTSLTASVKLYREFQALSQEAARSNPNGVYQMGWAMADSEIHGAIAEELARLWEHPEIGEAYRFPGATRIGQTYDPDQIPDLVTVICAGNDAAMARVTS